MATIILQVPDDSIADKVKQACKMLVGVTSVKLQKEKKENLRLYDPETEEYLNDESIKIIEDAHNGIGVTQYDSVDDLFKKLKIKV
ncbi:MAG: hypothetical protein J6Y72_10595 [Bacteroidales bacterium]|nr:hypothetical protein [Bacteroidales bacterium]